MDLGKYLMARFIFGRLATVSHFSSSFTANEIQVASLIIHDPIVTDAQRDQVTKDPGVLLVEEDTALELDLIPDTLHPRDFSLASMPNVKISSPKEKRAISYSTQVDAVSELIMVSQPT